ncbi:AAA family ATPase [Nocardia australiensis]|uniref:AAA family ATPase n=1 Tax=Nocardia australiensis TaxID=2887191 RepID=UPI001D1350E9|nr:LuxR family transcriptional regulator [Nocardia australiensis]
MFERSFVGRGDDLRALRSTCGEADPPWVLLVEGPAGIGKSRLADEFAREIGERGIRVVSVTATEYEQAEPLHLVGDIVERLSDIDADVADEVLADGDVTELGRQLRRRFATTETLLVVDDVHWADTESLRILEYLIRNRPGGSLRLLLSYREGQCPASIARQLRATRAQTLHLRVPPFTESDVADLLPDTAPERRDRLLSASHGNPLYLLLLAELSEPELERAVRGENPEPSSNDYAALDRTIRAELAQLPRRERLVAQAAAVCGVHADVELLCATAQLPGTAVTAALDDLAGRGVLTVSGGAVAFGHPLLRTAAYRLAGHGWRAETHRRAAEVLRKREAPLPIRARHLESALLGTDEIAARELMRAAEQVLASAPATSVRWICAAMRAAPGRSSADPVDGGRSESGAALDGGPSAAAGRTSDALLLGRALLLSGSAERAGEVLGSVSAQSGPHRLEALLLSARCERILGRVDTARTLLATAASLPRRPGDGPVQLELAILEMQDHRDAEGGARLNTLFASDAIDDPAVRVAATALRCLSLVADLRITEAITSYRQAERDFGLLTDVQLREVVHAVPALGWAAFFLDDDRKGVAHLERAMRVSRRFGRSYALPELQTVRAYSLAKLGRLADAVAAAEDADESARQFGYGDLLSFAGAVKLRTLQSMSSRAEVLEQWHAVAALPRPVMGWWREVVETTLSDVGGWLGVAEADHARSPIDDRPGPLHATQLGRFAHMALADGDLPVALDAVTAAEAAAELIGRPGQQAAAALARAEYACATDDLIAAESAVLMCIEKFGAAGMPVNRAQGVLLAATIAGRRGAFTLATARLSEARAVFADVGAHALLSETTTIQRRLAGSQTVRGATALTRREREVAELAALGCANKEIAARLYVSPRTVEDHLSRILRKLGLSSRAGIARRLAELDAGSRAGDDAVVTGIGWMEEALCGTKGWTSQR